MEKWVAPGLKVGDWKKPADTQPKNYWHGRVKSLIQERHVSKKKKKRGGGDKHREDLPTCSVPGECSAAARLFKLVSVPAMPLAPSLLHSLM